MPKNLNKGNFVTPTVLTGVTDSMRVWREEIFGPVARLPRSAATVRRANAPP